jgi:hypothetical protein
MYQIEVTIPGYNSTITLDFPDKIEALKYVNNQREAFPDSGITYQLITTIITKEEIK